MKKKSKSQIIQDLIDIESKDRLSSDEIDKMANMPELLDIYMKSSIENTFAELLFRLTNEKYTEKKAEKLWTAILDHKNDVNNKLNRDVGILVATLDYLTNVVKEISNPKISLDKNIENAARMATTDPMTGLYSRNVLNIILEKEIIQSIRYKKNLSLLMIDIDDFKIINDSYGHQEGDGVIIDIVGIISNQIRKADIFARYGGEEFAIVMPETDNEEAANVAERIRSDVFDKIKRETTRVSVSIGIGKLSESINSTYSLIKSADNALYIAKKDGKNCIRSESSE